MASHTAPAGIGLGEGDPLAQKTGMILVFLTVAAGRLVCIPGTSDEADATDVSFGDLQSASHKAHKAHRETPDHIVIEQKKI